MNSDWKTSTVGLGSLRAVAQTWDHEQENAAMALLRAANVVPSDVAWARKNRLPKFNLNRDALPAEYLAEVAYEWDQEGPSHPLDFVSAIEKECVGPDREAITKVLTGLGKPMEVDY